MSTRKTPSAPTTLDAPPRQQAAGIGCALVVFAVTVVALAPSIQNEFISWDDDGNYQNNRVIRGLSPDHLVQMWRSTKLGVWQPLTWFFTAIEYRLFGRGDDARFSLGMHAVSILLHAAAAFVCFFVVRRLIELSSPRLAERDRVAVNLGALAAALLFGIHPMRAEVVAWASGQPYVFGVLFALLCVWAYLRACEARSGRWRLAAVAFFAASLLCKSMGVMLFAVLIVLDVYPLRRFAGEPGLRSRELRRAMLQKIPYLIIALAVTAAAMWANADVRDYQAEPSSVKILTALYGLGFYASRTIVPAGMAPYYAAPDSLTWTQPAVVAQGAMFIALAIAAIALRRRLPSLLAVLSVYVVILLPVLGVVQHGEQLAANRYAYLSCIAWAALVGGVIAHVWANARRGGAVRTICIVFMASAVVGLGAMTMRASRVWRNSISFWSTVVETNADCDICHYGLAQAYEATGDAPMAIERYRRATELSPNYPEANINLGILLMSRGDFEGAEASYRAALRGRPGDYRAHMNFAHLCVLRGELDAAADHLRRAADDAARRNRQDMLREIERRLSDVERIRRGG